MIPTSDVKEITLIDYFHIFWKRIWIVISTVGIVVGFVAYKDFTTPKVYRATATVLVKTEIPEVTGQEKEIYKTGVPERQTQMLLLKSASLADRVIERLQLLKNPEFINSRNPAKQLHDMITVYQLQDSGIFAVDVEGGEPLLIAKIANAWVEAFVEADIERRTSVVREGMAWLEKQMNEALTALESAEVNLNEFIKENRIVGIPEVGKKTERSIDNLQNQKVQLEKELIQARKLYKEKHPKIIDLQNQLGAVEFKLTEETDAMYGTQEKALEYNLLSREAETHKTRYERFRKRLQDLDVSQKLSASNLQVVDLSQPPSQPIYPNPKKDIMTALFISLACSLAFCYFLEYIDSTLKTSEDVEFYTKMPFLGYVPQAEKESRKVPSPDMIAHDQQCSQVAEAFRNIRVSLLFVSPEDRPIRSLIVTSSIPQEGKSFSAVNLAITFANAKEPTLLMDADMRKGRIAEVFNAERTKGLTGVLAGMYPWQEAVVQTLIPNLSVLPSGITAPNPTQLLNSEKLSEILTQLQNRFKRVIIDTPPLLSVADSLILASQTSGLVFVIKARSTPLSFIAEAKKIVGTKVQILGAILNSVDLKKDHYYYYHYSYSTPASSPKIR